MTAFKDDPAAEAGSAPSTAGRDPPVTVDRVPRPPDTATIVIVWLRRYRIVLLTAAAAALYLVGLGRPPLWEPDEGRYAEIAREMLVSGDYVTPRNDWVRYFEKPPLIYWTTAAAMKVLGQNEFAARLPAALSSVAQVAITALLGEVMFGATVGILAGVCLGLSPLFFGFARFATPDPALAACFTLGLAAFWMAARSGDFHVRAGRRWMWLAAAALALGTLAKGPVALVLGGAIALAWMVVEGRGRDALTIRWFENVLIYLAITLPWFVVVTQRNPGFLEFFVVHEHLHRYLANTEHGWGPYFFFIVVAGGFWPWLYFVPFSLRELQRRATADQRESDQGEFARTQSAHKVESKADQFVDDRSALTFLLLWFGLVFIFFSIPRAKLGEYILPGFPPLAILAAKGIVASLSPRARVARRLGGFLIINLAVAAAIILFAIMTRDRLGRALTGDTVIVALAFAAGGLGACLSGRRFPHASAVAIPVAIAVVIAMGALVKARDDAAPRFSYRMLAYTIRPDLTPDCILASYHHQIQALPFYTGLREVLVGYRGELAPFSTSPDARASFIANDAELAAQWAATACVVVIVNRRDLAHLQRLLPRPQSLIGCEGKKVALTNRVMISDRACMSDGRAEN